MRMVWCWPEELATAGVAYEMTGGGAAQRNHQHIHTNSYQVNLHTTLNLSLSTESLFQLQFRSFDCDATRAESAATWLRRPIRNSPASTYRIITHPLIAATARLTSLDLPPHLVLVCRVLRPFLLFFSLPLPTVALVWDSCNLNSLSAVSRLFAIFPCIPVLNPRTPPTSPLPWGKSTTVIAVIYHVLDTTV